MKLVHGMWGESRREHERGNEAAPQGQRAFGAVRHSFVGLPYCLPAVPAAKASQSQHTVLMWAQDFVLLWWRVLSATRCWPVALI